MEKTKESYTATRNPCKLCSPLGASIVFRGIRGAIALLHGSQGCSTYIRRYLINHFREPVDIASSNFSENSAIFGGSHNLINGLKNICKQYNPEVIGVATTCLSETIGDDVPMILREFFLKNASLSLPEIVHVSTPSYSQTHIDGFHCAVLSVVSQLACNGDKRPGQIGIFCGLVSPADIRYLKEVLIDFGLDPIILPDYSDTLDGGPWQDYQRIQQGGTSIKQIESLGRSEAIIEFGHSLESKETAGRFLEDDFFVKRYSLGLPIGIKLTDIFFKTLEELSGRKTSDKYNAARLRLIDSYADGHKYIFEKKAIVYGEEDLVISVASFLFEIGAIPVVCATGVKTKTFKGILTEIASTYDREIIIYEDIDFEQLQENVQDLDIDFMIGDSKGYYLARKMHIPLIRIGFPIHDRIGAQRILHLGYRGTQQLFDTIINTLIQQKQDSCPVGYPYI